MKNAGIVSIIIGVVLWILQLMSMAGRGEWHGLMMSMRWSLGFVYGAGFWIGSNWAGLLGTLMIIAGIAMRRKGEASLYMTGVEGAMALSKSARKFSIASGVVAILATILPVVVLIEIITVYADLGISVDMDLFFLHSFDPIVKIFSMVLCAVYFFAYYGKKKSPLLGISALLLAAFWFISCIVIVVNISGILSTVRSYYTFLLVVGLTNTVIFVTIAIKILTMKHNAIIVFPVVAFIMAMISPIISMALLDYFRTNILDMISRLLYIVPFMLYALFCPPIKFELPDSTPLN